MWDLKLKIGLQAPVQPISVLACSSPKSKTCVRRFFSIPESKKGEKKVKKVQANSPKKIPYPLQMCCQNLEKKKGRFRCLKNCNKTQPLCQNTLQSSEFITRTDKLKQFSILWCQLIHKYIWTLQLEIEKYASSSTKSYSEKMTLMFLLHSDLKELR